MTSNTRPTFHTVTIYTCNDSFTKHNETHADLGAALRFAKAEAEFPATLHTTIYENSETISVIRHAV